MIDYEAKRAVAAPGSKEELIAIAEIIRSQFTTNTKMCIGYREASAMGSDDSHSGGLRFKINRSQWIEIKLSYADLYDIEMFHIYKGQRKHEVLVEEVYCDQLDDILYDLSVGKIQ